jgi:hypothetical protein
MKAKATPGQQRFRPTHGMTGKPTWRSWREMLARCQNPNNDRYASYGGRGIKVCDRWQLFENFLADMGERPDGTSLDRIDNDGNYEPSNCRWADAFEQQANTRQAQPVRVNGIFYRTAGEAARALGIHRATLQSRLDRGASGYERRSRLHGDGG